MWWSAYGVSLLEPLLGAEPQRPGAVEPVQQDLHAAAPHPRLSQLRHQLLPRLGIRHAEVAAAAQRLAVAGRGVDGHRRE